MKKEMDIRERSLNNNATTEEPYERSEDFSDAGDCVFTHV